MLLENIKVQNFVNVDRRIGFDIHETRAVIKVFYQSNQINLLISLCLNLMTSLRFLKQLAKFHSLCIATRRLEPIVFDSRIRPFLKPINTMITSDSERLVNVSNYYTVNLYALFGSEKPQFDILLFHLFTI